MTFRIKIKISIPTIIPIVSPIINLDTRIKSRFSLFKYEKYKELKKEFWNNVFVPGKDTELNPELEKAGRVADLIELGDLMIRDAADRKESCGAHFREEYQTDEGEALRNDDKYSYVSGI